jgi:hypothetical protein
MLKSTKKRNFQYLYHIVSWGLPIVILIIALSFRALGTTLCVRRVRVVCHTHHVLMPSSPSGADDFSRAVGWCWISDQVEHPLFWSFFVGKSEEITSYIVVRSPPLLACLHSLVVVLFTSFLDRRHSCCTR